MRADTGFCSMHPLSVFSFFLVAVVLSIFFSNPIFLVISLMGSFLLYLSVCGFKALKLLASLSLLVVFLVIVSPFFNPMGDTVVFRYFGDRPYTIEAVLYSLSVAVAFVSVIFWFASYSKIMTADKFNALFGNVAPRICILFSMVNQMSRRFIRRWKSISDAWEINHSNTGSFNSRMAKVTESASELAGLTMWAMESSIDTADSMTSRGFELKHKTVYSPFVFRRTDMVFMIILICLGVIVLVSAMTGVAFSTYLPTYSSSSNTFMRAICALSFAALVLMPTTMNFWECLSWRFCLSKI